MIRTEITRLPCVNDKWAVEFTTYEGPSRQYERLRSKSISAPLFESYSAAVNAGNRALAVLNNTNCFPDLCQPF